MDASEPPQIMKIDQHSELRIISEQDATALFLLVDSNRTHLRQWLPWIDFVRSVNDELAFIRNSQMQLENNANPCYLIWHKEQIAGMVSYHPIDWSNRKGELGYWLGERFQGLGLVTRACQLVIAYGFEILELNKIEIRCATGNIRSCAVPQRLGFVREGVVRQGEWLYNRFVDLVLYGLLASEWQQRKR